MPRYLRHGPEKDVHRFPGFLTMFAYDKAVDSVDSRKTGASYTLRTISGQTQPTKRRRTFLRIQLGNQKVRCRYGKPESDSEAERR